MEQIPLEDKSKHLGHREAVKDSQHDFTNGKLYMTDLEAALEYSGVAALVNSGKAMDVIYLGFSNSTGLGLPAL